MLDNVILFEALDAAGSQIKMFGSLCWNLLDQELREPTMMAFWRYDFILVD
jgi:hypothetical protein